MSLSVSDLDRQIEQLRRCEIIKEREVKMLCDKAREILMEESNVQRVDTPVTVSDLSNENIRTTLTNLFSLFRFVETFMDSFGT